MLDLDNEQDVTTGELEKSINKMVDNALNKAIESLSGKNLTTSSKIVDNIISFVGAAGGVGTTTVVANLASQLVKSGMRVLVVDLNILYPMQHNLNGAKQEIKKKDLVSFLLGNNAIGASIDNQGDLALLYSNNRYLMDYINCDTEAVSRNFIEAVKRVRHLFDMIIFDCPRQLEFDLVNTALYNSDLIYVVWDENVECISNIDRMRKNMAVSGIEAYSKIKVVFNKKTNIYYTNSIFKELGIEVVGVLPFDTAIIESGLRGEIFCQRGASISKNAAEYVRNMQLLADRVLKIGGYGDGQ